MKLNLVCDLGRFTIDTRLERVESVQDFLAIPIILFLDLW
jgi:hypothetical protein